MKKEESRRILNVEQKNCLDAEFDHIPVHIFSTQGNFSLIVILALLFK